MDKKHNIQEIPLLNKPIKTYQNNNNSKYGYLDSSHVNFSVESNTTKPIDISLMTGNEEGKKVNKNKRIRKNHK